MTDKEKLQKAMQSIKEGKNDVALTLLIQVAENASTKRDYKNAARVFEKAAILANNMNLIDDALVYFEKAAIEYMRMSDDAVHPEIVRLNLLAAKSAMASHEHGTAAEFYFRAADFESGEKKTEILLQAIEALENLADQREEEGKLRESIKLAKRISRLYHSLGDEELGERMSERAIRMALRWAEEAKQARDYLMMGNALAEAAQLYQSRDDFVEAAKLMMEAGEQYLAAEAYEKAGNIFDAAQEIYKLERLSTARNQAILKAAEAYVKMEGKPESMAPLLVKAGDMFTEVQSIMRARWAYKKANEIFGQLAKSAAEMRDIESEKTYLRYKAMCLKKWGNDEEAEEIYADVINYFLSQAEKEGNEGNKELQAVSLEAAADVLTEVGKADEAKLHIEKAIELYVELADASSANESPEESSRFYSKAADCSRKLKDYEREESFRWIASEKAEEAAKQYEEIGVYELATMWRRTAGLEALQIGKEEVIEKAISFLEESAKGFRNIGEHKESFKDLFEVYATMFASRRPEYHERIESIIAEMDEIAKRTKDETLQAVMAVLKPLQGKKYVAALLALQEREDDLTDRADRLRELIRMGEGKIRIE